MYPILIYFKIIFSADIDFTGKNILKKKKERKRKKRAWLFSSLLSSLFFLLSFFLFFVFFLVFFLFLPLHYYEGVSMEQIVIRQWLITEMCNQMNSCNVWRIE